MAHGLIAENAKCNSIENEIWHYFHKATVVCITMKKKCDIERSCEVLRVISTKTCASEGESQGKQANDKMEAMPSREKECLPSLGRKYDAWHTRCTWNSPDLIAVIKARGKIMVSVLGKGNQTITFFKQHMSRLANSAQ